MAKQCAHCGKIQPSDTTRFCTACGNAVASTRPVKRSLSEDPPVWMKQLETIFTNDRSNVPSRELRVRVWDQEETKELSSQENSKVSLEDEVNVVDDLPTRPLSVPSSVTISAQSHAKSKGVSIDIEEEQVADEVPTNPHIASQPQNQSTHHDEIQDISTHPHVAQPRNISPVLRKPIHQQNQAVQTPVGPLYSPVMQRPVTPMLFPQPQLPSAQPARQTPPLSIPVPSLVKPKRNKRTLFAIMFGIFFILLLIGGVIAWVIVVQPFAVSDITNTTQTFQNTSLEVSLQYPLKWTQEVNKDNGSINFYDDNQTDQVKITIVATGSQSIDQYMSKTASSLGMTGTKTQSVLSFARASWQQIQGNVPQSGAIYTATLLVTMHGEHFYTILQLAPSSTYALEDQLVFSKIRSSFQFLS